MQSRYTMDYGKCSQKGKPDKIPTELVEIFDKYNSFEIDDISSLI